MQKTIVNSTPMIILSKIGMIEILHKLFGEITIPKAVYDEVTFKSDIASRIIMENDWINIESVSSNVDRSMYKSKLHDGEVEVMILAQESFGDVLTIIDDNTAKKTAKYLGLTVTGTLGVLTLAKNKGYIDSLKEVVQLIKRNGFYISATVEEFVLKASGESRTEIL